MIIKDFYFHNLFNQPNINPVACFKHVMGKTYELGQATPLEVSIYTICNQATRSDKDLESQKLSFTIAELHPKNLQLVLALSHDLALKNNHLEKASAFKSRLEQLEKTNKLLPLADANPNSATAVSPSTGPFAGIYQNVVLSNEAATVMTLLSGEQCEGKLTIADGKINGAGTCKKSNGGVYEGDIIDGKMQGKGKYTWPNDGVYKGDFVAGKMHGKGISTCPDGGVYEGDFVDGKMTNFFSIRQFIQYLGSKIWKILPF